MITYTEASGGSGGYTTIQEEGSSLPQRTTMDFVGGGVTATDNGSKTVVTVPIQPAYATIQEEGTPLVQQAVIDFQGAGVTASNGVGKTVVTIPIQPAYATIQDEGSALAQQPIIDFQGAGVTATNSVGKTIVTINGSAISVISLLNSAMLALISGGTVVAGQFYIITDANYSNAGGVLVQGVTTSSITRSGTGLFFNADYQGVGNYSSAIPTYGTNLGIWGNLTSPPPVSAGDVVVWNNRNYINLTGAWGTQPNTDSINWSLLAYSVTQGYIFETDFVLYDVNANNIIYGADKRNNEVDLYNNMADLYNTLNDFQWGRDKASYNKIKGQSNCVTTNSAATITGNFVENGTYIDTTIVTEAGNFQYNTITAQAIVISARTSGNFRNNVISGVASSVSLAYLEVTSNFTNNQILEGSVFNAQCTTNTCQITNNTLIGASNITLSFLGTSVDSMTFSNNYLSNGGALTFGGALPTSAQAITGCQISDGISIDLGNIANASYVNKKVYKGYSNWEASLDLSNLAIYNSGTSTLTIPTSLAYVGIFSAKGSSGQTVSTIVNSPTNHNFTLKPSIESLPFTLRLLPIAIGSATTNNVIASTTTSVGTTLYVARTNGCDEAILGVYGNLVGLIIKNLWV